MNQKALRYGYTLRPKAVWLLKQPRSGARVFVLGESIEAGRRK
ncbi:hypothetical protein [Lacrimispora brassicae]